MKHPLALLSLTALALPLSACATTGYDGGLYAGSAYAYDGYYDGFYGSIYDGYWGNNGYFYYRGGPQERFRRGDRNHFHPNGPHPGGHFQPMQGNIRPAPGMRMPHFGGGPGHPRPSRHR